MTKKYDIIETTTVKSLYGDDVICKKIKNEFFKDSSKIAELESELAKKERNDCVVRAFMMVLDIPYDKSHKFVKDKFNRENLSGTYTSRYLKNILGCQKNGKKMRLMGYHPNQCFGSRKKLVNPNYKKETGYTVKSFMEQHTVGRYFIIVKGHALALVDGVLYGNPNEQFNGFRRQAHYIIKCG